MGMVAEMASSDGTSRNARLACLLGADHLWIMGKDELWVTPVPLANDHGWIRITVELDYRSTDVTAETEASLFQAFRERRHGDKGKFAASQR